MENPDPRPDVGGIIGAIALLAVGLLIFVPCGLCTGFFFFPGIIHAIENPSEAGGLTLSVVALVLGGPFIVGGASMIWLGAKTLMRSFGGRS